MELGIYIRGFSKGYQTNYVRFDELNDGKFTKIYDKQLAQDFTQAQMQAIAEEIKKDIERNLKLGLRFDGRGAVKPLAQSTIEAKKRKGRRNPSRVFVDSGKLIQSVKILKKGGSYTVTFKDLRYPKSDATVPEVAKYLNEGTNRMPARPFFGVTQKRIKELIDKYIVKKNKRRMQKRVVLRNTKGVEF